MNYSDLKAAIRQSIKANGNFEITGNILQSELIAMIDSLGNGYQFMGVAAPETIPGAPDQKVFYLAGPGVYANFNAIEVPDGSIGALKFDSNGWALETITLDSYTKDEVDDLIEAITSLIPNQASEDNQLADKAFVNSSVQTATANFRGNWATKSAIPTNAADYPVDYAGSHTPTVNDYLVVQADESHSNETWRYKYSGVWETDGVSGWCAEYKVNETPLTAAQIAALNSGATESKINSISGKYTKPLSGIPKTDLASAVQSSLDKADSAEQFGLIIKQVSASIVSGSSVSFTWSAQPGKKRELINLVYSMQDNNDSLVLTIDYASFEDRGENYLLFANYSETDNISFNIAQSGAVIHSGDTPVDVPKIGASSGIPQAHGVLVKLIMLASNIAYIETKKLTFHF